MTRRTLANRLADKKFCRVRLGHDRTWSWQGLTLRSFAGVQGIVTGPDLRSDADVKNALLPIKTQ
jgi:hypothetical protein